MLNAKKNVSNAQLSRDLGLPYKTAWSLAFRIREAMLTDPEQKRLFEGIVEIDETYTGGKPKKGNIESGSQSSDNKSKHGCVVAKSVAKNELNVIRLTALCLRVVDAVSAIYRGYDDPMEVVRHYAANGRPHYVFNVLTSQMVGIAV
jgi:hypothetical protein